VYVDVAITRWQKATGMEAKLASSKESFAGVRENRKTV